MKKRAEVGDFPIRISERVGVRARSDSEDGLVRRALLDIHLGDDREFVGRIGKDPGSDEISEDILRPLHARRRREFQ